MHTTPWDVIVIGAGQSGLAAGYHLQKTNLRFLILEAKAEISGSWSHYYDSLHLFSPAAYSSLPGYSFPHACDHYASRDEVVAYLQAYAKHFRLPVQTQTQVLHVEEVNGRYRLHTNQQTYETRAVLVASGAFNQPNVPNLPGQQTYQGRLLHTYDYRNPQPFHGQRVVVVGAGNSAVQIAADLTPYAHVTIASHAPIQWKPQRVLGRDIHFWLRLTGLDALPPQKWLRQTAVIDSGHYRQALREGKFNWRPMFSGFTPSGVLWADGASEDVDSVIFATGYHLNIGFLQGLGIQPETKSPEHRGIYFVGLPFQRNLASATLRGAGPDAAHVVAQIRNDLQPQTRFSRWRTWLDNRREAFCQHYCTPSTSLSK